MKIYNLVVLTLFCLNVYSQNKIKLDSLLEKVKVENNDTVKAILFNKIKNQFFKRNDFDSALVYSNKALNSALKSKHNKFITFTLNQRGILFENLNEIDSSLFYFRKTLKIVNKSKYYVEYLTAINHIGVYYYYKGEYNNALKFYQIHLKVAEEHHDSTRIVGSMANIANIYIELKKHDVGLEYNKKALKICNPIYNKSQYRSLIFSIGNNYLEIAKTSGKSSDKDSCLFYIRRVENLAKIADDYFLTAYSLTTYGNIFYDEKKYDSAICFFNKAIQIRKTNNLEDDIDEFINLGLAYLEIGEANNCETIFKEILKNNYEKLSFSDLREIYTNLALISEIKKNYAEEVKFLKLSMQYTDSVFSSSSAEKRKELEMNFEFDKIQSFQKAEQEKKNIIAKEEIKQQKLISYVIVGGLVMVSFLAFFIFRGLKKQRKANYIIAEQKIIVEEKHKEITDSINYAERIQRSFLASDELLSENLKNYFVFFQPKDVVSGDFYWAASTPLSHPDSNQHLFYLVTADSTGHGVPGAIMSLLNITSIESAIKDGNTSPADILNATRKTIIERLKKDGSTEGGKDGMDCSLICFDFANNIFTYAAANNPVWVIRQNQLIELVPDKMPVGKHDKDQTSFTQSEYQFQKGDVVYVLTDGLPDQFGGPKGKKFMYKQLKELLISMATLPMEIQKEKLKESFVNWKGDLEQVDDVCVIGIKL